MTFQIKNNSVLITLDTNPLGAEIVRQCLREEPKTIRLFSRSEHELLELEQEFQDNRLRFLVGDVCDRYRLQQAVKDIDLIFHTYFYTSIPFAEYNPFEVVQTNVIGTQNLIETALEALVKKVITLSTQDAINPTTTVGASRLLSERLTSQANKRSLETIFSCIRLGNIIHPHNQFIQNLEKDITRDDPLQVSHLPTTQHITTINQAAVDAIKTAKLSHAGEVFIPPMKKLATKDLVEILCNHYGQKHNKKPVLIKEFENIENRPHELLTEDELARTYRLHDFLVIQNLFEGSKPFDQTFPLDFRDQPTPFIDTQEIKTLLKESGILN